MSRTGERARYAAAMTVDEILTQLEALGDPKRRKHNTKRGAGDNQFAVKRGDIRKVAKSAGSDRELALELWGTGNIDARLVAILMLKPTMLSTDELDAMVRSVGFSDVADWLNSYVVKLHPDREALRARWMADEDPMAARAGWNLTAIRVAKKPDGLDLAALLDRIEAEMGAAHPDAQWTMNFVLAEIGVHHPEHRERALAIGEELGVYRDFPTSKGCTSPFAPIWISEMVKRQG